MLQMVLHVVHTLKCGLSFVGTGQQPACSCTRRTRHPSSISDSARPRITLVLPALGVPANSISHGLRSRRAPTPVTGGSPALPVVARGTQPGHTDDACRETRPRRAYCAGVVARRLCRDG